MVSTIHVGGGIRQDARSSPLDPAQSLESLRSTKYLFHGKPNVWNEHLHMFKKEELYLNGYIIEVAGRA